MATKKKAEAKPKTKVEVEQTPATLFEFIKQQKEKQK
jgi:hypothetical protein